MLLPQIEHSTRQRWSGRIGELRLISIRKTKQSRKRRRRCVVPGTADDVRQSLVMYCCARWELSRVSSMLAWRGLRVCLTRGGVRRSSDLQRMSGGARCRGGRKKHKVGREQVVRIVLD